MAIKVTVNYPETEEGMKELERRHAEVVLDILNQMLTPIQLEKLIENLKTKQNIS